MSEIQFIRNRKYGTISTGKNGWTKEVCNVSWNQKGPKLDIREWAPDYGKMSRGITLTKAEAKKLLVVLASIDFESFDATDSLPQESVLQGKPVCQAPVVVGTIEETVETACLTEEPESSEDTAAETLELPVSAYSI